MTMMMIMTMMMMMMMRNLGKNEGSVEQLESGATVHVSPVVTSTIVEKIIILPPQTVS